LYKLLWLVFLDLEQQFAFLIGVVVSRNDFPTMRSTIAFTVPCRQTGFFANVVLAGEDVVA
jgi:hypothetical protein